MAATPLSFQDWLQVFNNTHSLYLVFPQLCRSIIAVSHFIYNYIGYYELAQVLLAMNASVDDRGSKGDCTPLMEASSGGYIDIVKLLLENAAEVNSQSQAGNTALIYACCGGYEDVVEVLLNHGADIEAHNENGHTPLMEAASGGHVNVAKMLLERGACINSHSNEFKESALTLACYKGMKVNGLQSKNIHCTKLTFIFSISEKRPVKLAETLILEEKSENREQWLIVT